MLAFLKNTTILFTTLVPFHEEALLSAQTPAQPACGGSPFTGRVPRAANLHLRTGHSWVHTQTAGNGPRVGVPCKCYKRQLLAHCTHAAVPFSHSASTRSAVRMNRGRPRHPPSLASRGSHVLGRGKRAERAQAWWHLVCAQDPPGRSSELSSQGGISASEALLPRGEVKSVSNPLSQTTTTAD